MSGGTRRPDQMANGFGHDIPSLETHTWYQKYLGNTLGESDPSNRLIIFSI
jgi:hypothetical protein